MKITKIAVFENNEELVAEIKDRISAAEGFEVCAESTNGNAALEMIMSAKPDVAIVDLVLIGLDGFGVLDFIKENRPECMTIAIGSFVDDKIINEAIEHGAVYYLAKPVKSETLMDRIRDLSSNKAIEYKITADLRDKRKVSSLDEKNQQYLYYHRYSAPYKRFCILARGHKNGGGRPVYYQ